MSGNAKRRNHDSNNRDVFFSAIDPELLFAQGAS
jgi:hypothetical protein